MANDIIVMDAFIPTTTGTAIAMAKVIAVMDTFIPTTTVNTSIIVTEAESIIITMEETTKVATVEVANE